LIINKRIRLCKGGNRISRLPPLWVMGKAARCYLVWTVTELLAALM
jgi:hypothetical protein